MKENIYYRYRIIKSTLERIIFYLFRVFPIDDYLVSICTFEGKGGFGCNPKYVVEELHKRDSRYRFVWLVNKDIWNKDFPDYIKIANNSSLLNRAYWLSRSAIWIDNYRKPLGTVKRKNQYYVNVNHYTVGIKCTGIFRGKAFSKIAYLVSKHDSSMINDLVIDSKWCEECFEKAFVYNGHMLKVGSPRCDVLYGDRSVYKSKIRQRNNLPEEAKILLFAPTFREGAKNGKRFVYSETSSIDFNRLIRNLETKFGGQWFICFRIHPQLIGFNMTFNNIDYNRFIDESKYDDFTELLAGSDAYITDYSSAIFEAGYAKIPAFIYADDIDDYCVNRGNLYWSFPNDRKKRITNNKSTHPKMSLTLPYTLAKNNDQLEEDIFAFDQIKYNKELDLFHESIGLVYNGNASAKVVDRIQSFINRE